MRREPRITRRAVPRAAIARGAAFAAVVLAIAACQLVVDTSGLAGGAPSGSPTADATPPESGSTVDGSAEGGAPEGGPVDGGEADGDAADASIVVPTLVQAQFHPESSVSAFSMSLLSPSGSGHTLLLVVGASDNQPSAVTSVGTTWSLVSETTPHVPVQVWRAAAVAGTNVQVTIDFPGTQVTALGTFTEWANLGALDTFVLAEGVSTALATGPIVATRGELVLAVAGMHNFTTGLPTSAFTALDSVSANDSRLLAAFSTATSMGSIGTSWTASTAGGWNTILLTFHPQ